MTFLVDDNWLLKQGKKIFNEEKKRERKRLPAIAKSANGAVLDLVNNSSMDLGSMTDSMKALLQQIRLRFKALFAIDLTTETEKEGREGEVGEKMVLNKKAVEFKLPSRLHLSMIRCVGKDKVRAGY